MKNAYDVIIVGTGVAGCFAALHLPADWEILMISKAGLEESDSYLAQGGICVLKNQQDYGDFVEDTMKAGHYQNTRAAVEMMIKSSPAVIDELEEYGVSFTAKDGKRCYTKEGGHCTNRILYHEDTTGKEITQTLLNQVQNRKNIEVLANTVMLDVLSRDNQCDGLFLKTEDGSFHGVYSKFVLWACGGIGGIFEHSTNYPHLTGDAVAIALQRKIRLKDTGCIQIHPTALYSPKSGRRFLISESVRGEGAVLYNRAGERFVDELLPRDLLTEQMRRQMEKDHMPHLWLSMEPVKADVKTRFPNIYRTCLAEGYDITREWIPVVPSQHYFMGGVAVDLDSKTSMKRLYAAGETSCNGVHGANRLASNSLLESLVFAKRAALHMAEAAKTEGVNQTPAALTQERLAGCYGLRPERYVHSLELARARKEAVWNEIRKVKKS